MYVTSARNLLPYPRFRWSASFHGYASLLPAPGTCFFTRDFSGLPRFAGKPAEASLARLASLPAISAVCPVSRVYEFVPSARNLLPYPRFQRSAPFRGYASLLPAPGTCFFTRDFSDLPHFAGMRVCYQRPELASLPANSVFCPVSRVNPRKPHLPDLLPHPRFQRSAPFRGYAS